MWHWLSQAFSTYVLHVQNHNGYQWWSGAGSDLGELALITAVIAAYRHVNCDAPRCWRRGPYKTAAGHKLCRKHHPEAHPRHLSLREIHLLHHEAKKEESS